MKTSIFSRIQFGLIVASMPIIALTSPASADQIVLAGYAEEVGESERVDFSGKLRMLSQRVVATSCTFNAGIDPETSGQHMQAAQAEFALIVDALENGNSDLGILGAEKRRKTLARVGAVKENWMPVAAALNAVGNDSSDAESVASVAKLSAPLLASAKDLVTEISAQYSNPAAMVQADAMLIDLSGRQRMLIQRMSKNACLIASDIQADAANQELTQTMQVFEATLTALRAGMPEAGIKSPPTVEIVDGLNVVAADWKALKPGISELLSNATLTSEKRAEIYHGMNQMTANMNKVVGLYSQASKRGSM